MPHPLENERLNTPLTPGEGQLHNNISHWIRDFWSQCEKLQCEIPVTDCEDTNRVFGADQNYMPEECGDDEFYPDPYVVIEDFGFVPSSRFQVREENLVKCTTGSKTVTIKVYHPKKEWSAALLSLFMCKMNVEAPHVILTKRLRHSKMQDRGFTEPQETRRNTYMSSQTLRWSAKRPRNIELPQCP